MIVISARHLLLDIALCLGSLQKPFSCCPHPYIFCLNENERENIYNIDRGFDNRKVRASFPYRMCKKTNKSSNLVSECSPNNTKHIKDHYYCRNSF